MILKGFSYKLPDDVNTDYIISGRYKFSITDIKELARHIMEDIDPTFYSRLKQGESLLVAGKNFGMGSSREQAPLVIKEAGILAVVAKSFARIFYRNSFNIGLPLIEADTGSINEADFLKIDFERGIIDNTSRPKTVKFNPWNKFQLELIKEAGIINYLEKHGDFVSL